MLERSERTDLNLGHRRFACVALPDIRVELAREQVEDRAAGGARRPVPLAVIVARPGAAVKTERDVLGNTRLDFVSREARDLGVAAGQTVAAARAKCADLRVRVVDEGAVASALARIAEAALAFGPTTAFDVAQDVVWVDVSGCAHLVGGEAGLARSLAGLIRSLGHGCRVAIADGPRLSAAVARFSREPAVVPHGKGHLAVRALPIAALGLDHETELWLAELGLSTCGDLQKLPRRALGTRLGERAGDVMKFLDGHDLAPVEAWRPPEVPEERFEFDWGVQAVDALAFVLKKLCDRLAARLEGRGMAAARLELVLGLDRALCEDAAPGSHRPVLSMQLPSPIVRAADLLAVVRARVDRCSLAAPVLAVTLRAPELARASSRTVDLFAPEPRADRVLPRLVAELGAEIGQECVGTLSLVDTWSPDERTRLLPFGSAPAKRGLSRAPLVTSALEPSRLVQAKRVPREALAAARHLARIESTEWWRADRAEDARRRDLFAAWVDGALAWLELTEGLPERRGEAREGHRRGPMSKARTQRSRPIGRGEGRPCVVDERGGAPLEGIQREGDPAESVLLRGLLD